MGLGWIMGGHHRGIYHGVMAEPLLCMAGSYRGPPSYVSHVIHHVCMRALDMWSTLRRLMGTLDSTPVSLAGQLMFETAWNKRNVSLLN